ncbi:MAG: hypothetical protein F6K19_47515 [Cyanothece sp. SIO1E1]|nr:hypothetical protein [Cyanothece sp. SIO1E1]
MSTSAAQAAGFTAIRIGDVDGFGYGRANGYQAANGDSANVDGKGLLGNGDLLPDLNQNGRLATNQGDDFDHRTISEIGNSHLTGNGFTDKGSSGSEFTDLSLSTSSLDDLFGITPLQVQRQELITQRQAIQTEINGFNTQIQLINDELAPLNSQRDEWLTQRQAIQTEINQINTQLENLRDQNQNQNQGQIDELKAQRQELRAQRANIEAQIDEVNTQREPLRSERAPLNTQRQELVAQRQSIQTDINVLATEIEQLRTANAPAGSRIPQPVFTFDFSVNQDDIAEDSPLYLNLLFADYDVKNAEIQFTTANGSFTRQLTRQRNQEGFDGLIQSAFVELSFSEVFTASEDGSDSFDGFLQAEIIAPDEPYLAFDFAELGTSQISIDPKDAESVPEPISALGLIAFGAFSTGSLWKRKQKQC